MQTNILHYDMITSVPHFGGGDPDVTTKDGRFTNFTLKISKPAVVHGTNKLRTNILYEIREGHKNYTHLKAVKDILIPFPSDWVNVNVLSASDFILNDTVLGKNHSWIPVNVNTVNWIKDLQIKIDGKGDDHRGNAQLAIALDIPVEYNVLSLSNVDLELLRKLLELINSNSANNLSTAQM